MMVLDAIEEAPSKFGTIRVSRFVGRSKNDGAKVETQQSTSGIKNATMQTNANPRDNKEALGEERELSFDKT